MSIEDVVVDACKRQFGKLKSLHDQLNEEDDGVAYASRGDYKVLAKDLMGVLSAFFQPDKRSPETPAGDLYREIRKWTQGW